MGLYWFVTTMCPDQNILLLKKELFCCFQPTKNMSLEFLYSRFLFPHYYLKQHYVEIGNLFGLAPPISNECFEYKSWVYNSLSDVM